MALAAFARIDDRWSLRGLPVVTLENELLRVVLCPTLGACILHFEHRPSGHDLLWQNPRIEHRAVPIGASYDDNFSGSSDELFPNDLAGPVGGDVSPDHGELWCQPWSHEVVERTPAQVTAYLRRTGSVTTTTVEKWITLRATESEVRFRHRVTNHGSAPLDLLWKLPPALAIDAGDSVDVPGTTAELVNAEFGRVSAPARFAWPDAPRSDGESVDMSVVPALDGTRDFVYVRDLSAGWCALRRRSLGLGFGMVFPTDVCRSVWLFMSFGGWRGYDTVVLEPGTTVPKDLVEAIRLGTARRLAAGEMLECEVRAVLFEGSELINGSDDDGRSIR